MFKTNHKFKSPHALQHSGQATTRRRVVLSLLVIGLATFASYALAVYEPEDVGHEWGLTAEAANRTAAGECPNGGRCLEWCTVYQGGELVGTGIFACF